MLTFFTLWRNVVAFITFFRFTKTELSTIRGVVTINNWEYPHFFFALIIKTVITISSVLSMITLCVWSQWSQSPLSPGLLTLLTSDCGPQCRHQASRANPASESCSDHSHCRDPATELVFVWVWGAGGGRKVTGGALWGSHFCGEGSVISSRYI